MRRRTIVGTEIVAWMLYAYLGAPFTVGQTPKGPTDEELHDQEDQTEAKQEG